MSSNSYSYRIGDLYWKQAGPNEWILGKHLALDEATESITFAAVNEATGAVVPNSESILDLKATSLLPANPLFTTSADMTALRYLHEAALVKNLYDRWIADDRKPYSSMSNVLIAVNPLRYLPKVEKAPYVRQSLDKSPPHPYHVAENSYRQLRSVKQNQSIIISGESGSGKTETSKIILDFLTDRSSLNEKQTLNTSSIDDDEQHQALEHALGDRLMETIPILESFGNAKTHRNHNSSRFGKYMRLQFTPAENSETKYHALHLTGASIDTYLLETSRVVVPPTGERNFHIFYELLRSGDDALLRDLKLVPNPYNALSDGEKDADAWINQYQYLKKSGCTSNNFVDDASNFKRLLAALKCVNIDATELFQVVSGLLHLGNVKFSEEDTSEGMTAAVHENDKDGAITVAAEMMGLDPDDLMEAILTKKISRMANDTVLEKRTGRPGLQREASVYYAKKDLRQASFSRDTIAKIIYEQVFGSLMRQCAAALEYNAEKKDELPYIGVLDIFGFEDFEPNNRNSLEQLLINYANESLQSLFNQCILKAEQELYQTEHIWSPQNANLLFPFGEFDTPTTTTPVFDQQPHQLVSYDDNKECLSLIAAKNDGMFSVLDTVGKLAGPTDRKLIERFHTLFKKHPCFVAPHPKDMVHTFCIRHFAGVVRYRIDSFIDKNSNIISTQFEDLIKSSTLSILSSAFPEQSNELTVSRRRGGAAANKNSGSVALSFSTQMKGLLTELESTRCNFIRCIKPNAAMDVTIFNRASVLEQLRCSGTIQACQVLQVGLPTRVNFEEIVDIYTALLGNDFMFKFPLSGRLFTQALCSVLEFPADAYRLGDTRIFFKTGKIHLLDTLLNITLIMEPEELKKRLIHYLVKRRWICAVTKVAVSRRMQIMCEECQHKRRAVVLQCWYRQILARRELAKLRKQHRIAKVWCKFTKNLRVQSAFEGVTEDKLLLLHALLRQRSVASHSKWLLTWLGPLQRAMYVQKLGKAACIAYLAKRAFVSLLAKVQERRASIKIQAQIRRMLAKKHVEVLRKKVRAQKLWQRIRIRVKATIWFFAMYRRAHVLNLERENARLKEENESVAAKLHDSNNALAESEALAKSLEAQIMLLQQQLQEANRANNYQNMSTSPNATKAFSFVETNSTSSSDWMHGNAPETSSEDGFSTSFNPPSLLVRESSLKLRRYDSDLSSQLLREVEQQQELTKKIRNLVLNINCIRPQSQVP